MSLFDYITISLPRQGFFEGGHDKRMNVFPN